MERLKRLAEFWSWLPAFRAVAETANLHVAARELGISPSALSRTIRLLERNLDRKLFNRRGRSLELNESGEQFLARVRDAMRLTDDGLMEITAHQTTRSLHVSSIGMLTDLVLPILGGLRREYSRLVCHLYHFPAEMVNDRLLQGRLDVALLLEPIPHARLAIEVLGAASNGIYCGEGHPLYRARRLTIERILGFPFAAPVPSESGAAADSWPVTFPRRVEMELTQLRVAAEVCAAGSLLVVLPDPFARAYPDKRKLRRLPIDVVPPTMYYAVRRETIDRTDVQTDSLAERVVDRLRACMGHGGD